MRSIDEYININDYILRPLLERQSHLDLSLQCLELGGDSEEYRGTLSWCLKTTIPRGMKIHLCHACHNGKCGNPKHLYWGTAAENYKDAVASGRRDHVVFMPSREEAIARGKINCKYLPSAKDTIWVTNGVKNLRISPDKVPEGFVRGRIWFSTKIKNKIYIST